MRKRRPYKQENAKICSILTSAGVIEYDLFHSSRRRTMELSVYEGDRLRAVVPNYVTEDQVNRFIRERAGWIEQRLKEAQVRQRFLNSRKYETGHEFLFLGKHYPLSVQYAQIKRPRMKFDEAGWTIELFQGIAQAQVPEIVKARLIVWYRGQAMEVFGGRVFYFARHMGLEPLKVCVRAQKQVWGTCRYGDKQISLNWKLIMAPLEVIDYVVVHELAHLRHPNHSKKFWAVVETVLPEYQVSEEWLKAHRLEMMLP